MLRAAVTWVESQVGARIVGSERLTGGLTSTMLALDDERGGAWVLRLMTEEPWRRHGPELTARESVALEALAGTNVPAPRSVALDAAGDETVVAAHLMTWLPGRPHPSPSGEQLGAMARLLAEIHDVRPDRPFREFQSWAWDAKLVVPAWTRHPAAWRRAFAVLAEPAPAYEPTFLHRDHSHRNLLWEGGRVAGVVDWVETSTGPASLDVAHAATNLAVHVGPDRAWELTRRYATETGRAVGTYWQVMDAVGFLPPPGGTLMFGQRDQVRRLDDWLAGAVARHDAG